MASNASFAPPIEMTVMSVPGLMSRFFEGLDGAEGHVIVVREQHIDPATFRLEEGCHHLLSLVALEHAGLGPDDFVAPPGGHAFT
ncbi:MAG TPA: hypothetical protein VIT67_06005 [Povalibacter sp.]